MSQPNPTIIRDALSRVRSAIVELVADANQTTESEAFSAGAAVNEIVSAARTNIDETRAVIGALKNDDNDQAVHVVAGRQQKLIASFLGNVGQIMAEQRQALAEAEAQSRGILQIGEVIKALASSARLLSLNAQIESQRLGEHGAAFEVIAAEMQRMSVRVGEANVEVASLAEKLMGAIPACVEQGNAMDEETTSFSERFNSLITQMDQSVELLGGQIESAMHGGERHLNSILSASQRALSHLQFQDPVAQRLLRIDTLFAELQREVAGALGESSEAWGIEKEVHTELGARMGEGLFDESEVPDAGDVMLF